MINSLILKFLFCIFLMFVLYCIIFSPKSIIKYIFFRYKMKKIYTSLKIIGYEDGIALKMISSLLHPELGDIVHEEIVEKFSQLSEVITFIYWGMDKYSTAASKISDDIALAIVRAGRIQKMPKKVIIDNKMVTDELEKIQTSYNFN